MPQFQQSGRAINDKVRLFASVGAALNAARAAAADPYQAIEAILSWTAFVDSVAEAEQLARPARFDPQALLTTAFPRVRRYAPTLLDSFHFNGSSSCKPLLDGVKLLKELNSSERLKSVPSDATHRVRLSALGAARRVGDRRNRPPILRAVCPEHPCATGCARAMCGWRAAASIRPSTNTCCGAPSSVTCSMPVLT
jgi:hypothetical protein